MSATDTKAEPDEVAITLHGTDGLGWTIHIPAEPPCPVNRPKGRCPLPRSLSYSTWQYSVELDYAAFEILTAALYDLWENLEQHHGGSLDEPYGAMFEALISHIEGLQQWTGWAGVAADYIGGADR